MFIVKQHTERPLRWWFNQFDNIELDPPYQRRSNIWRIRDQQFLIDTIINEFDIPKFYIADFTSVNAALDKSGKLYSVIDGKQRFEAIFKFFRGEISLANDFAYFNDSTIRLAGLSYQDLELHYPKIARAVNEYIITVMSVVTDAVEDDKIKQLFIRLNKGEGLSGAEKRNAMSGPIPTIAYAISLHPFFKENIRFSVGRGQDLNTAAKLILIEYRKRLTGTKKNDLDKFVQEAADVAVDNLQSQTTLAIFPEARQEDAYNEAYVRVIQVLNTMAEVFYSKDNLLSGSGSLPLYYWLVRNESGIYKKSLRGFLSSFETDRLKNRAAANRGVENVDQEMLNYNLINRSPDDVSSLELRYTILVKRLVHFSETKTSNSLLSV